MVADPPMVLFVCHANLCRSPIAERLARQALGVGSAPVTVVSAGTHAVAGLPMHRVAAQVLRELGAEPGGFTSQRLTEDLVARAALVLAADRRQRAICASMYPPALRRTFTIRQLGRLAGTVDAAGLRTSDTESAGNLAPSGVEWVERLLSQVPAARARVQPASADEDDLPDPVRGPVEHFRACALEIRRALRPVLAPVAPG